MNAIASGRLPALPQLRLAIADDLSPWTGWLAHAALVALIATSLLLNRPAVTLALGGSTVFPLYLWLCRREGRRAPLYVSPLSFMFFWNSIGLGLSAIYMAVGASAGEYVSFSTMRLSPADIAQGYVIYLVGMLFMHGGMEVQRPATEKSSYGGDLPFARPLPLISGGFALGLLYLFRQHWFSVLGSLAGPLGRMSIASLSLLGLLPWWYLGLKRHMHRTLLLIGTLFLALANAKSGSKAYIMFAFFPVAWAIIARKELRRNFVYAGIVVALLYIGLVAPTITESRIHAPADRRTDYAVLWDSAERAAPLLSGNWQLNPYSDQVEHYLGRMFDPAPVAFLVQDVALHGYRYGETMKYAAYAFVPRLLWPEKPNVSRGAWFTTYLGFAPREAESTTSTGITAVGELYWNFGMLGVVAGMCALGMMLGRLWRMAGPNPIVSPLHMLLYVHLTLGMPDLAEWVTLVVGSLSMWILFGSVFFLLRNRSRL